MNLLAPGLICTSRVTGFKKINIWRVCTKTQKDKQNLLAVSFHSGLLAVSFHSSFLAVSVHSDCFVSLQDLYIEYCPNQQLKANCKQPGVKANHKQTRVKDNRTQTGKSKQPQVFFIVLGFDPKLIRGTNLVVIHYVSYFILSVPLRPSKASSPPLCGVTVLGCGLVVVLSQPVPPSTGRLRVQAWHDMPTAASSCLKGQCHELCIHHFLIKS